MAWSLDAGTATKKSAKASPGSVFSFMVTNVGSSLRWFQLHNTASVPSAGQTAQVYFPLPAGTSSQPTVLEMGNAMLGGVESFTTGIGWAISSTPDTFTDAATANEHTVIVRYG